MTTHAMRGNATIQGIARMSDSSSSDHEGRIAKLRTIIARLVRQRDSLYCVAAGLLTRPIKVKDGQSAHSALLKPYLAWMAESKDDSRLLIAGYFFGGVIREDTESPFDSHSSVATTIHGNTSMEELKEVVKAVIQALDDKAIHSYHNEPKAVPRSQAPLLMSYAAMKLSEANQYLSKAIASN